MTSQVFHPVVTQYFNEHQKLTHYDQQDCEAMLDILMKTQPRYTKAHPCDYIRQIKLTEKCDAIMPFLAIARQQVKYATEVKPQTPTESLDKTVYRNIDRQYEDTFGHLKYLGTKSHLIWNKLTGFW